MFMWWIILLFPQLIPAFPEKFLGCYNNGPSKMYAAYSSNDLKQCITECQQKYYRYSLMTVGGACYCHNFLNQQLNDTLRCNEYCRNCENRANLTDVYETGILVPGPPKNLRVINITESSVQLLWELPESYTEITSYGVKVKVMETYSNYIPYPKSFVYSNDTFKSELSDLFPSTKYEISVYAVSSDGREGAKATQIIITKLAEPDHIPDQPKIIKRDKSKLEIKINSVINNNGPISTYLVVVVDKSANQVFQKESLKSYHEAKNDGISYYITAEIDPKDIDRNFVIGDGNYYGGFYNAPLNSNTNYDIIIGMKSKFNGDEKIVYSSLQSPHKQLILDVDNYQEVNGDSPAVIIGLSIAIGLFSFMLVAGIIGFIILKSRVTSSRQRLSNNQELILQGPIIEVENNGYIPEEEPTKINHYRNLKDKLKSIPYSNLKIEPTHLLGIGRFGRVNTGSIVENNTVIPASVYSISDKKLNQDDKKTMLKDLDLLIRTGKHENVLMLLGTCETPQLVFVVLEYLSMNLKDLLLGSRDALPGRFSNMTENQALDFAIGVAKGMAHLESNKIIHKQLCARSIMVSNGTIPKISGYGLAQYYSHNNLPDFTRWTSIESFKGQDLTSKSDVWSFGCLLWEICVLGGTPYGSLSNNEVPDKVIKGMRLLQMQYFSDNLYNVMLNCWQIDIDERPSFKDLINILEDLKTHSLIPFLNFNQYPSFQYEQFYPDMEIAVRPVF